MNEKITCECIYLQVAAGSYNYIEPIWFGEVLICCGVVALFLSLLYITIQRTTTYVHIPCFQRAILYTHQFISTTSLQDRLRTHSSSEFTWSLNSLNEGLTSLSPTLCRPSSVIWGKLGRNLIYHKRLFKVQSVCFIEDKTALIP